MNRFAPFVPRMGAQEATNILAQIGQPEIGLIRSDQQVETSVPYDHNGLRISPRFPLHGNPCGKGNPELIYLRLCDRPIDSLRSAAQALAFLNLVGMENVEISAPPPQTECSASELHPDLTAPTTLPLSDGLVFSACCPEPKSRIAFLLSPFACPVRLEAKLRKACRHEPDYSECKQA